jgi:hypothetical protein
MMFKEPFPKEMAQLRAAIAHENGQHDSTCYYETCKAARVKNLDDLFDRLQQQPPWPVGRLDMDTQPELLTAIHDALHELTGRDKQKPPDPGNGHPR